MDEFEKFYKLRKERTLSYLKQLGYDARFKIISEDLNLYSINVHINSKINYSIGLVSYDEVDLLCVLNVRPEDVDLSILISHKLMNEYDYLKVFIVYNSSTSLHTVNFSVCLGEYDDGFIVNGIKILSHSIETYLMYVNEFRHKSRDEILLDVDL